MKRRRFAAAATLALVLVASAPVDAAPGSATEAAPSLRSRFGLDVALRLMRSPDAAERLRGIERTSAIRTPEAMALLVRASLPSPPGGLDAHPALEGISRLDPRALLSVVRGLATWVAVGSAREALASILSAPTQTLDTRVSTIPPRDPGEAAALVTLALQEAAIALDRSGNTIALEALVAVARSAGAAQEAALDALAVDPPAGPIALGGVALTTRSTIALAARLGDLRTLDAILGVLPASDAGLRAAAIEALATAGDTRVIDIARSSAHDVDARVRLAAAGALVRLRAPDAGAAVEANVADKETALDALALARDVESEGVTRAVAALAVASGDPAWRAAALTALGRQTTPLAVRALLTLAEDPRLKGDAAYAIARSPSGAALGALEEMAVAGARVAARAYMVRRYTRGERSARLDSLLQRLAASGDARDRAVGVQALVALGEASLDRALSDRDPRVRRAAAMAGMTPGSGHGAAILLARLAVESDAATRRLLATGLAEGDPGEAVPTSALVERAQSGATDAPLAALALARRTDSATDANVSALLTSRDPLVRAHTARGLGLGSAPDAPGRLARAYEFETAVGVRRLIVAALAQWSKEAAATLELAAQLDPDAVVRSLAQSSLDGARPAGRPLVREVAWMRVVEADGAALPTDMAGMLVQSDGLAVPIAFDEDGYALVPGVPPGEARLRLAPGLPAYLAPSP